MTTKYAAHHDIRRNLGCILWISFFSGIAAVIQGLRSAPAMQSWMLFVVGFDLIAVAVGLWYAKEWARWAAGLVASAYFLGGLVNVIVAVAVKGDTAGLLGLFTTGLMGLLAWYSFLPSTRRSFAEAREMIARSRSKAV